MPLPQVEYRSRGRGRLLSSLADALQEEQQPALPVAATTDRRQPVVVLGAVTPEVVAEVEQRAMEHAAMHEQERDQQSPDAPVPVHEGMDGLELGVRETDVDQRGKVVVLMQEALEVIERLMHGWDGRGHESRALDRRALRPNPILVAPELASKAMRPPAAL